MQMGAPSAVVPQRKLAGQSASLVQAGGEPEVVGWRHSRRMSAPVTGSAASVKRMRCGVRVQVSPSCGSKSS